MKKINVSPALCGPVHLDIRLPCKNGDIIIQDINAFLRVGDHFIGIKAVHAYDDQRGNQAAGRDERRQPDFGFNVFNDHDHWLLNKKGRPALAGQPEMIGEREI